MFLLIMNFAWDTLKCLSLTCMAQSRHFPLVSDESKTRSWNYRHLLILVFRSCEIFWCMINVFSIWPEEIILNCSLFSLTFPKIHWFSILHTCKHSISRKSRENFEQNLRGGLEQSGRGEPMEEWNGSETCIFRFFFKQIQNYTGLVLRNQHY